MSVILRSAVATFAIFWTGSLLAAECQVTSIAVNQTTSGFLSDNDCQISDVLNSIDSSRVDVFRFTISVAGNITINLDSTEFDPFLRLLADDLSPIAQDDDSGNGFNAAISTQLDAGSYRILANSATSTSETGSYTLTTTGPAGTTPEPTLEASKLINISTRAFVGTGDSVTIGGLIIEGDVPKTVVIRAIGPDLANRNVAGVITDPQLQLFKGADLIDSNDEWDQHARKSEIPAHLIPNFQLEAVIVATLEPGAYTAIVRGNSATTGVGLIEIYEADDSASRLENISTRGDVGTGDNVMIGGLIISGSQSKTVLIRAIGPSLANFDVPGPLLDPVLQIFSGQALVDSNDNWQTHANASNVPQNLQPTDPNESAILVTLLPGAYTAIVSGAGGSTGIGLVEVFEVQ